MTRKTNENYLAMPNEPRNHFAMARLAMTNGVKPFLVRLFIAKKTCVDVINFSKSF